MPRLAPASGTLLRPAWIALLVCVFLFPCSFVAAHPVPRRAHDRTIAATLAVGGDKKHVAVTVAYRLEVDEATVVLDDLPALGHKIDLRRAPNEVDALYQAFTDSYAPILAGNLLAKVDNELLQFRCSRKQHRLKDEAGVALNHLRCDFVFQAEAGAQAKAGAHEFTFREGNYEFEEGLIRLSLVADPSIAIVSKTEPDAALQALPPAQLRPGDDARLRTLRATFASAGTAQEPSQAQKLPEAAPPQSWWSWLQQVNLRDLFHESKYGFWTLMLLSLAVGGIHAMTPGHGKTLVAAYLVGERGTVGHAFVLGLVTTLTHTGVVIAIAAALRLFVPGGRLTAAGQQQLQAVLELGGGVLVACLGFWLLLRRLAGQADHFHLPGHGHHHSHEDDHSHEHGHADHYHDERGHVQPTPGADGVKWWGLVMLGINGGIVPCWDAIVVLLLAVSTNRLALALPMLLAFSAGLAGVLILVGVAVVRAKHLASARLQKSRATRMLPVVSAAVITLLGLWLCYDSLHPKL